MKTILVVTNSKRKELAFVSDELDTYSLEEAIQLTSKGKIDNTHIVHRNTGSYIRTNPKVAKKDEFDTISITIRNLLLYTQS